MLLLCLIMAIEIKKPVTKEKVQQAVEQLNKETEKKSLRKHFGKLKRSLDGLDYQKQVRNEWV
jgi:two-component SAPR family response regulator